MHRCPCENEKERVKCSRSINFYGDLNVHGKLTAKSLVVKDAKINDLAAGGIITEALAAKELAAKELVAKDAKIENLIVKDLIFDTTNLFNNVTLTGNTSINDGSINIGTHEGDVTTIGGAGSSVNINNANQIRLAAQSAVVSGNILYVIGNNLYFGKTKLTRN